MDTVTARAAARNNDEVYLGIPGTVHLIDAEHGVHSRHAGKGAEDIVLVPVPSNDSEDPLNWKPGRKLLSSISWAV